MRGITVVMLLGVALGRDVRAQDLEYTSTTQFSIAPSLGATSGMLGAGRSISSHVYVKGSLLRFDMGTSSSIIDTEKRRVIVLDHAHRTAAVMALNEPADRRSDSLSAGSVLTVRADRERRRINGVAARRTSIMVRVPARNVNAARARDVVVINELWTTDSGAIGKSYKRVARFADQVGAGASMMFGMIAQSPSVGAAMAQAARAAARVPGMPVRTVAAYGNVAAGSKFDPGMRMDTVMAVVTNVTSVRNAVLSNTLFAVPAGYRRTGTGMGTGMGMGMGMGMGTGMGMGMGMGMGTGMGMGMGMGMMKRVDLSLETALK